MKSPNNSRKEDATKPVEFARFEVLKCVQENMNVTEIASYRGTSRATIHKVINTLIRKEMLIRVGWGDYEITDHGYSHTGLKKPKPKKIKQINPRKIYKVRTEIEFSGDIRELKDFLLGKKHLFMKPQIKERKRDISLKIRREVLKRSKSLCEKCGKKGEEIDHIIPFCVGGKHVLENLRFLCLKCHRETFSKFGTIKILGSNINKDRIIIKS